LSRPRLLVDENLSVALPPIAHARGFECGHVAHLGFHQWKDWSLLERIAEEDWVLVTNNAVEFRGRFHKIELHPGVVFILPNVRRALQIELFEAALDDLEANPDLINMAIDVSYEGGDIVVRRYALP
jgi:predicted nuclease of predicted toxin-antitoxin system